MMYQSQLVLLGTANIYDKTPKYILVHYIYIREIGQTIYIYYSFFNFNSWLNEAN